MLRAAAAGRRRRCGPLPPGTPQELGDRIAQIWPGACCRGRRSVSRLCCLRRSATPSRPWTCPAHLQPPALTVAADLLASAFNASVDTWTVAPSPSSARLSAASGGPPAASSPRAGRRRTCRPCSTRGTAPAPNRHAAERRDRGSRPAFRPTARSVGAVPVDMGPGPGAGRRPPSAVAQRFGNAAVGMRRRTPDPAGPQLPFRHPARPVPGGVR